MEEIFKDIEGYEGLYQISNLGRVKSLGNIAKGGNKKDKILSPSSNRIGYYHVVLTKNNKQKSFHIHRLVALAFLDKIDGKSEVNHIDGDKSNNNADNLEWVTHRENVNHAYSLKIHPVVKGEGSPNHKLTWEIVDWIRGHYKARDKEFGSEAMARKFNVSSTAVRDVVLNRTWIAIDNFDEV